MVTQKGEKKQRERIGNEDTHTRAGKHPDDSVACRAFASSAGSLCAGIC